MIPFRSNLAQRNLDPLWNMVTLLIGADGADSSTVFVDEGYRPHVVSRFGAAQVKTGVKKFGTGALKLTGADADYLQLADSNDWWFSNKAFTVEGWFYWDANGSNHCLIGQWTANNATSGWALYLPTGGILRWRFYDSGGTMRDLSFTWTPPTLQWHHLCVERDATGKTRMYINGVMVASSTVMNQTFRNTGLALRIGSLSGFTGFGVNGRFDELRITTGAARYANDAGFTPPTEPFLRG